MNNDNYDDGAVEKESKRYPLQWDEGLRPDDIEIEVEQSEDD